MSKRANNEGSIYKRSDGRWAASISIGGGKRKAFYGKTRSDVARKLTAALKNTHDGIPLVGERQTVNSYLNEWLRTIEPNLRPESFRRYRELSLLHIIPEIGKIPLARLSPQQVQTAYARRLASGLSGTTVQHIHGVLHKALNQAVRWNLVVRNVADLVDSPRRTTPEMRTLTPEEAIRFVTAAAGERLEAAYVLAITCGLRLGEIQALRWRAVDIERSTLAVTAALQAIESGRPVFAEPKTAKSRRVVQMPVIAVDALRRHRIKQIEERLRAGEMWEDHDLVFTNERGRPLDGNNFRARAFRPLLAKAGLPAIRFHDLRHTAATLMMNDGIPVKVASERLGHADVTVTLKTYSHVLPGMQQQAADSMDRLFSSK